VLVGGTTSWLRYGTARHAQAVRLQSSHTWVLQARKTHHAALSDIEHNARSSHVPSAVIWLSGAPHADLSRGTYSGIQILLQGRQPSSPQRATAHTLSMLFLLKE
jgi:hypothetical protein